MDLNIFFRIFRIAACILVSVCALKTYKCRARLFGGRFELAPPLDPHTQHSACSLPAHTLAPLLGLLSLEQSATIWGPGQEQAGNSKTSQN